MKDNKSILLVEDEVLIALGKQQELEKYGYIVQHTNTGEKAVVIIKENKEIDLILMDIDLGKGIDGTEAAAIILKNHNIPIVFMSSHTDPEIVEKTEKITSYGYVVKSASITVLDASIKMAFKLFDANSKTEKHRQHLRTTLKSIGDAVITTDILGNVTDMNPVAENLTGWSFELAFGKPLSEVFHIINEGTHEKIDNPVKNVLETGNIMGLANHTVLISKDGLEHQITDSAAPIKDSDGLITGVVLVF
ncbi:MAG: histidine kinase, partial [Spirochaetes bacterium]